MHRQLLSVSVRRLAVATHRKRLWNSHTSAFVQQQQVQNWSFSQSMCTHVGAGSGGRSGEPVRRQPPEIPFAVKGLKHIAVAVPDLAVAAEHFRNVFGAQVSDPLALPEHGVTTVFVQLPNLHMELIHPLGDNSPISKFLEKNPKGGIHHICLAVDDLNLAIDHLSGLGVATLGDGKPKIGAEGEPVMFLHPKDNFGVLTELQQANPPIREEADRVASV